MRTPFLYRLSRALVRIALSVYFRKVERSGARHVPGTGPVILAANHPQSVTDALVLGRCAGRMLHYIARSGIFDKPLKAWFLRNSGVIPVYRPRETAGAADKNVEMFSACRKLLENGGAIGIFPEGISAEERRVQRLRTGTARIAFESEEKNGWRLGVVIVPVGLNFESGRRFRSRVLVTFGKPIVVADYRDDYEADPFEAVRSLTDLLGEAIRRRVVNIERGQFEELVRDVESVYKGELLEKEGLPFAGSSKFERDQEVSREIPRALDFFFRYHPEIIWQVGSLLSDYRRKLERLRIKDEMIRQREGKTVPGETTRFVVFGTLGVPFALYGAVWNGIPYHITDWLARRMVKNVTKFHFFHLTRGAAVYVLYYGALLYLAFRVLGPTGTAVFAATLPLTGFFALDYSRRMRRRRQMLRLAFLELTHGYFVQKLRQQRQRLMDEMDTALEEYLRSRDEPSSSPAAGRGVGRGEREQTPKADHDA
ncbi:MAG: lysophospholipid acyltransferase family protein [Candidatus Krumholzibacteriia bacterium]